MRIILTSPLRHLRSLRRESGYSLIELAIVIGVTGMIMASGMNAGRIYTKGQSEQTTVSNLDSLTSALDQCRILNRPEEAAYDGYHATLQYAVTESLAVPQTYKDTEGAISIVDDNGTPLFDLTKQGARYLVFSTGPDQNGAWNNQGQMILPCD